MPIVAMTVERSPIARSTVQLVFGDDFGTDAYGNEWNALVVMCWNALVECTC